MKLISCHVQNYGKISDADFTFGQITSVCQDNGYGKTTLASFLKAMLYGLDSDRANTEFNERRHFYPFEGGVFGGSLTLEAAGKIYRIERTFDMKSQPKDTLTVYCDGREQDLGEEPGQKFFGIDRQSFERTVFISGTDVKILTTGSINKRLNALVEGDDADYGVACDRLDARCREYKKARGEGGLIYAQTQKLNQLSARIADKQAVAANLAGKYGQYDRMKKDISALSAKIAEAQTQNVALANWESYSQMEAEIALKRQQLANIQSHYPCGMPAQEEVEELYAVIEQRKTAQAQLEQKTFTDEDESRYCDLQKKFNDNPPTPQRTGDIRGAIEKFTEYGYQINALRGQELSAQEQSVVNRFKNSPPAATDGNSAANGGPFKKIYVLLAAVFALLAIAGAVTMFFYLPAGGIMLGVGLVALALTGFVYLNKKAGYVSAQTADASFNADAATYARLLAENEQKQRRLAELDSARGELAREIEDFFKGYGIYGWDYGAQLSVLLAERATFNDLSARRQSWAAAEERLNKRIYRSSVQIEGFCGKYGFNPDRIEEQSTRFLADIAGCERLSGEISAAQNRAQKFKTDKGLTARPQGSPGDIAGLNGRLAQVQQQAATLYKQIAEDEKEAELIEELQAEYDNAAALLAKYKYQYKLLGSALQCLQTADSALKNKYVQPVKDKFLGYSAMLKDALGEKIVITPDFEVRYERAGKQRSDEHLSSGQKALCALCFRLALIDSMYSAEKPFVILDDPFVGLDQVHLQRAIELLRRLAGERQIVYFTCHSSRALATA